jgi:hypothetical protein
MRLLGTPFRTYETVARDTRARRATSALVAGRGNPSTSIWQQRVVEWMRPVERYRGVAELLMDTLSSYEPLQQHALTRFGRLKMLQRDVLPKLDTSDYRVKLTLKALYSTYQDLQDLGLGDEARALLEQDR